MTFAAVGGTGYDIMLFVHIATAMIAFAPAFVHPFLAQQASDFDPASRSKLLGFFATNGRRVYAPALVVTGLLGFGIAGLSDDVYKVRHGWLIAAVIIWIAMNGVLHAIILPADKAMAEGSPGADDKAMLGGMLITLLLAVMLFLMVFKPGA